MTRRTRPQDGESGFTLIELLVVVVILGILAAVVVFAMRGSTEKGTEAAAATDERIIRTAQEAYCTQAGQYGSGKQLAGIDPAQNGQTYKFLSDEPKVHTVTASNDPPTGPCDGWRYDITRVDPPVSTVPTTTPPELCDGAPPVPAPALALDPSFDLDGMQTTDFGSTADSASAVVIDASDRIVAVGGGFNLARYDVCGVLDTSYDSDGKQTTRFPDAAGRTFSNATARAVANAPGGKIVVAGTVSVAEADGTTHTDFAVARYTATGVLDTTFSDDGMVTTDIGITDPLRGTTTPSDDGATGVAIDSNGKIVVAGSSAGLFAVVRFTATGGLDSSFDSDGKVTTNMQVTPSPGPGYSLPSFANAVVIDANDKILLAGQSSPNPGPVNVAGTDFTLARYTPTGALDLTFGAGGKVYLDLGYQDGASALALQSDGKIVAAGYVVPTAEIYSNFAVVRLEANGARDALFGDEGGGVFKSRFESSGAGAHAVALQPDGKIVAVGWAERGNVGGADFAVARLSPDGQSIGPEDVTGTNGPDTIFTDFGARDRAFGVAIHRSGSRAGRIVTAGSGSASGDFALARYLAL